MLRQLGFDLRLKVATRDVHRVDQRTLFVFVRLAYVENQRRCSSDGRLCPGGVDLADLGLGCIQQLTKRCHLALLWRNQRTAGNAGGASAPIH